VRAAFLPFSLNLLFKSADALCLIKELGSPLLELIDEDYKYEDEDHHEDDPHYHCRVEKSFIV
jgi:hypothetical protein